MSPDELVAPESLVVGVWGRPDDENPFGKGYTAPTKVYYAPDMSGTVDVACGVNGLTDEEYASTLLQPFKSTAPAPPIKAKKGNGGGGGAS